MQDDLSELLERVEHSRQKTDEMQRRVTQLSDASISHWLFTWGQPGVGEIKAKLLTNPPVSIREDLGMIVNSQRSILDYLACKLAKRNGANHTNDVYFPITKTKAGYDELGQRKIRKLSDADKDAIEKLKPWLPSDDDPEDGNQILFQLHEADRVKKHQDLLRWACLGGVHPIGDGFIQTMHSGTVVFREVGKEESLAFFTNVSCDLGVQFDMVYIEPPALDGYAVGPLLGAFNDTVEGIVRSFA